MIEPLRYTEEIHPTYEILRPTFCHSCLTQKQTRNNPNIAIRFCYQCPTTNGADKEYGAFLCRSCDEANHNTHSSRKHHRHVLVLGPGVRKKIVTRGDGKNFPLPLDHVTVRMRARVYHMGRTVHKVSSKETTFVSGMSGKCLHIQVLGARNLSIGDLNGTSDPFIVYSFCGKQLGSTRVRPRSVNPRWNNETFILPMDESLPPPRDVPPSQREIVRLEAYDYDWVTKDEFLGHLEITRSKLEKLALLAKNAPVRLPLTRREYHGLLNIQLGQTSSHLHLRVVRGDSLDKKDTRALSNPFAKIYMGANRQLIGTTSVVYKTVNPIWKGGNEFKVKIIDVLFAERYLQSQIDAFRQTRDHQIRRQRMYEKSQANMQRANSKILKEFEELPSKYSLLRIEVYDFRTFKDPQLLGVAYFPLSRFRKILPSFPAADITNLQDFAEYSRKTAEAEQQRRLDEIKLQEDEFNRRWYRRIFNIICRPLSRSRQDTKRPLLNDGNKRSELVNQQFAPVGSTGARRMNLIGSSPLQQQDIHDIPPSIPSQLMHSPAVKYEVASGHPRDDGATPALLPPAPSEEDNQFHLKDSFMDIDVEEHPMLTTDSAPLQITAAVAAAADASHSNLNSDRSRISSKDSERSHSQSSNSSKPKRKSERPPPPKIDTNFTSSANSDTNQSSEKSSSRKSNHSSYQPPPSSFRLPPGEMPPPDEVSNSNIDHQSLVSQEYSRNPSDSSEVQARKSSRTESQVDSSSYAEEQSQSLMEPSTTTNDKDIVSESATDSEVEEKESLLMGSPVVLNDEEEENSGSDEPDEDEEDEDEEDEDESEYSENEEESDDESDDESGSRSQSQQSVSVNSRSVNKPAPLLSKLSRSFSMGAKSTSADNSQKLSRSGSRLFRGLSFKQNEEIRWSSLTPLPVFLEFARGRMKNVDEKPQVGFIILRLVASSRGNVLLGLDEALRQMTVGETSKVRCRYDYAYNSFCMGPDVPPRSNVIFNVKLLAINGQGKFSMPMRQLLRFYRLMKRVKGRFIHYFFGGQAVDKKKKKKVKKGHAPKTWYGKILASMGLISAGEEKDEDDDEESDSESSGSYSESEYSSDEESASLLDDYDDVSDQSSSIDSVEYRSARIKPDPRLRKHINPSVNAGSSILWGYKPPQKKLKIKKTAAQRRAEKEMAKRKKLQAIREDESEGSEDGEYYDDEEESGAEEEEKSESEYSRSSRSSRRSQRSNRHQADDSYAPGESGMSGESSNSQIAGQVDDESYYSNAIFAHRPNKRGRGSTRR